MNSDLINKAIVFAAEAHKTQKRKKTEIPYIVHPLEAGVIAAAMSDDDRVVAAAFLHDTLEDTGTNAETLKELFGERVAYLVVNESENKREGTPESETWKLRKQETIDHLRNCTDEDVKIIALSDKLANLRAINRDYAELGEEFWKRFNQSDPSELKWYYSSFLDTCKSLESRQPYKEYAELIEKVFGKFETK